MDDIANIDQALRLIWEKVVKEQPDSFNVDDAVIEFGKRCVKLGQGHERLADMVEAFNLNSRTLPRA